ncbi:zinc-dependent alcohol dehydrogenase family protein [Sphingomonas sp. BT-65]|uniref:zinc-dependent alcohol dehydrogenase family protein n=1 Tax=Sphingomonas sp. BT-65 TaxID=2989821 RepID=UPI0022365538|nr:zinc-dependent alcohol dehydrogenase family protein [Sphingomonas sp. BT-65]MCW4461640.1 zinc-dependent alcohol dehydrogenase family protein [Sphingomonas sp. BT-65]
MPRHVEFEQTGGPEVLRFVEAEVPEPAAGEVRIAVKAIGLNRAESLYRSGTYIIDPVFPARLGSEAAGVIDAVGPGVEGLAPGDRVAVVPAFSYHDYGMYGDLVLAPARAVAKLPDTLGWVDAAAVWMAYVTAWGALIDTAGLRAGETVLIPAASSSVGLAAIQVANRIGAVPVALTRTSAKAAALREQGAAHVIATDEADLVAEVERITGGAGARVVFDPVGGPGFARLTAVTATRGTIIVYGALDPRETPLPVGQVLGRSLTVRGYLIYEATQDDAKLAAAKAFVLDGLVSGDLHPRIDRTFPFDAIADAHRYLEGNGQIGKIVVTM